MGTIVAIGGMSKEIEDIKKICNKIIELSKKEKPKLLYIPTANNDHKTYSKYMANFFEDNYPCTVDILWLMNQQIDFKDVDNKIKNADIVFVEGGNLVTLLETWKKYGIDEKLKKAYQDGVIMSGISAGANCWFEYSYSDSVAGEEFAFVKGLGIIKGCICPHYNDKKRRNSFAGKIRIKDSNFDIVYGIEEDNAIVFENSRLLFISENEHEPSGVHVLRRIPRERER